MANEYCTVADVKTALGIPGVTWDAMLAIAVEAASRAIDKLTEAIWLPQAATRKFTAEDGSRVVVRDLLSVTTLKTDADADRVYEVAWGPSDYDLEPANSLPKREIRTAPLGSYSFPAHRNGVEIVGTWGNATAVPANIKQACILLVGRLYKRKDAPLGIMGAPEIGLFVQLARTDPDVMMLLPAPRRFVV